MTTMRQCRRWVAVVICALFVVGVWWNISRPRWKVLDGQDHVVGFSADGRVLATIDQNGIGYLWDPETGESRDDLAGKVTGLPFPFSPDGRYHVARLPFSALVPDKNMDLLQLKDAWIAQLSASNRVSVRETLSKRAIIEWFSGMDSFQARRLGFASNGKYFSRIGFWKIPCSKIRRACGVCRTGTLSMISIHSRWPFLQMGKVWRQSLSSRRKTIFVPF